MRDDRDVFSGFPPETQSFLAELAAHNDRDWFETNRERYERYYLEPAKEFVVAVGDRLRAIAPEIEALPRINGSIFRINRDVRFSKDKTPYRPTVDFWFWEGPRRAAISGFFLRVAPEGLWVGAGCHGFDGPRLARYREALLRDDAREELLAAAEQVRTAGYELKGAGFKRIPRAVESLAGTPAAPLALFNGLSAVAEEPAALARDGAALVERCERHWSAAAPLHRWLVAHVQ